MSELNQPIKKLRDFFSGTRGKLLLLFSIEGLLYQFTVSMGGSGGFGTNLYATNLGATDTQIGMNQLITNCTAVLLMLPIGILSDRMKNAKTVPISLMLFMGVTFILYGTVPNMGQNRIVFFFLFLALTAGIVAEYNVIWQAFFGDITPEQERNSVYTFRSRFCFLFATAIPLLCGALLTAQPDADHKLFILRIFYYICSAACFANAFVLSRIPGGQRSPELIASQPKLSLPVLKEILSTLVHDKRFVRYFICIMFFYVTWHVDWSMWYISQINYVGLTEVQLSIFTACQAILQLFFIGFFGKMVEKKGLQFTFLFTILSLVFCPVLMLVSVCFPVNLRPAFFIIAGGPVMIGQACAALCTVQMLLKVVPEKNRSLIVSLNMLFVTLSNGVMPFLGVQLYNAMGGDFAAFIFFNIIVLLGRSTSMLIFIIRYKKNALGEELLMKK